MAKKKSPASDLNAGQKITAARRGLISVDSLKEYAASLSEASAQLTTYIHEMERAKLREMEVDGATQFDRGMSTIRSFRKNVGIAIIKALNRN